MKDIVITPDTKGNPTYEIIKREDITGAFRDALSSAILEVLSRIDSLIATITSTASQGLWTWNYTARWDYDKWW
jgi:hypothetical protein